ncbi:MAG: serine/threonine protein kinase [Planctomycetes bacterium]|nr:serine/threonine protein kinase [Planctomycetota bacterium]
MSIESSNLSRAKAIKQLYELAEQPAEKGEGANFFEDIEAGFSRYENLELIGEGGVKRIYKAYDTTTGRTIAIAVLKPEAPEDLFDAFIREAKLTAFLDHPNIITVHDTGFTEEDAPFFSMQLIEGSSLKSMILSKENSPQHEYLDIFIKVAEAVSYAHSRGVIHLDLKPDNVQIGPFGDVQVCDWGLGKILEQKASEFDLPLPMNDTLTSFTLCGEVKGTPGYMAPEQIEAEGQKGKHSDIFSLGAILYTMMSGEAPFIGSREEIFKRTLEGSYAPLRNRRPAVSASLDAISSRALARKPEDRYSTVQELIKDIQSYRSGYAPYAEQASFYRELVLFVSRHKRFCLAIALVSLLISSLVFSFMSHLNKKNSTIKNSLNILQQTQVELKSALRDAENERSKSQQALAIVKRERELSEYAFDMALPKTIMDEMYYQTDVAAFLKTKKALDTALVFLKAQQKKNPSYPKITMQLGYIAFLQQDLHKAHSFLVRESTTATDLRDFCHSFILEHKSSSTPLPLIQIQGIFKRFYPKRIGALLIMLYYDAEIRHNINEHSELVKTYLKLLNPSWSGNFIYEEKTNALKLSGHGLNRLGIHPNNTKLLIQGLPSAVSALASLNLSSLDLSSTDFYDLRELGNCSITDLDISHTLVTQLENIEKLKSLTHLTVAKGQFSLAKLKLLPQRIKLLIAD